MVDFSKRCRLSPLKVDQALGERPHKHTWYSHKLGSAIREGFDYRCQQRGCPYWKVSTTVHTKRLPTHLTEEQSRCSVCMLPGWMGYDYYETELCAEHLEYQRGVQARR